MEISMKLLLKKEGEGEEEGVVGGRDPEVHKGEDGQGDD